MMKFFNFAAFHCKKALFFVFGCNRVTKFRRN
jgi:hypothetical protein